MFLAFASRTSNIKNIVSKLNLGSENLFDILSNPDFVLDRDFCVLTYTDLLGSIPKEVDQFLSINSVFLKAVAGSGNRNFGDNFCGAVDKIHEKYGVPIICKFELSGDEESILQFRDFLVNN